MNVDGESGNNIEQITISANDSMFVFLELTIDPTNTNTPYLVSESILFNTGNIQQDVNLIAYGQEVIFTLTLLVKLSMEMIQILLSQIKL